MTDNSNNQLAPSRRDFLAMMTNGFLTLAGLLGLGGFFRFLSYAPESARQTEFLLDAATAYPVGSRTIIAEIPALLIHDEGGFSALSLICPHLGCTVEKEGATGLVCPCHGSRFDADGIVQHGPATDDLPALTVKIDAEGRVLVKTI